MSEGKNQVTLGELRDALARATPTAEVRLDVLGLYAHGLHSWRGSYDEPAIGWSVERFDRQGRPIDVTAGALCLQIDEALGGKVFHGYKGGEYRYRRSSPVNIDNWGEYTCTRLVNVTVEETRVVLHVHTEQA